MVVSQFRLCSRSWGRKQSHHQQPPAVVAFCNVNTSVGDPQIEHHCIHFQLTFQPCFQTLETWNTESRAASAATRRPHSKSRQWLKMPENINVYKMQTHLFIQIRAQSAKVCFIFSSPLPFLVHTHQRMLSPRACTVSLNALVSAAASQPPLCSPCLCGFSSHTSPTT